MSYSATILSTPGLLAYWPLSESSGTTADDALGAADGTYSGGCTLGMPGAPGGIGPSVEFNGTNGYVEVPSSAAVHPTPDFSAEVWFRLATLPSADKSILGCGNSANSSPFMDYGLKINADNRFGVLFSTPSTLRTLYTSAAAIAGAWYHLVCTYDGTTVRLYVNGVADTTLAVTGALRSSGMPFEIGRYNRGGAFGEYFAGRLAHAAVYSAALSPATVRAHYGARAAGPPASIAVAPPSPRWRPARAPAGCKVYLPLSVPTPAIRNLVDGMAVSYGSAATPTWGSGVYGAQLGGFTTSNYPLLSPPSQVLGANYPCWFATLAVSSSTQDGWLVCQGTSFSSQAGLTYNIGTPGRLLYALLGTGGDKGVGAYGLPLYDGLPHVAMGWSNSASDHHLAWDGIEVASGSGDVGTLADGGIRLGSPTNAINPFPGSLVAVLAGNGALPDPKALADDLLSGAFSAVRPRANLVLLAAAAAAAPPVATRGHKGRGGGKGAGHAVYRLGTRTPGTPTPGL